MFLSACPEPVSSTWKSPYLLPRLVNPIQVGYVVVRWRNAIGPFYAQPIVLGQFCFAPWPIEALHIIDLLLHTVSFSSFPKWR